MCEYLKRMSPQDTPTDDIRRWSGLAHSVVEYTGPRPFGMDGSMYLWLHERSATQLLDMCDELDAKFSDLKSENAKLRELVAQIRDDWESERDYADQMEAKEKRAVSENAKLREFAKMFAKVADVVGCDPCPYCNPDLCDEEIDPMKDGCRLYEEMRELGVTDD